MKNAIVLAAGKGTRMKSEMNKVMHPIIDRPILFYILDALKEAGAQRTVIVAGYQAQSLMNACPDMEFAIQQEQLGTGHAVMQATMLEGEEGQTLIINGDVPCIKPETLKALYEKGQDKSLVLLSAILPDGAHYGRIVRDENGQVVAITEAKDCTPEEKEIREINAGVYCFNNKDLFEALKELTTDNAQHEYYLTDLVKILNQKGKSVDAWAMDDPAEMAGINTVEELHDVYQWMKENTNKAWMEKGVQIVDPARTVIGKDVQIGHDVIIYPNTEILGNSVIGDYAQILPNSYLKNAIIGKHAQILSSTIENAKIDDSAVVTMAAIMEGNEN